MVKSKYDYYEKSTQSPKLSMHYFDKIYTEIRGVKARIMREDFCGTFLHCCEWVKRRPDNIAIGVDLDPEPLEYGRSKHLARLKPEQRKRVKLLEKNVLEKFAHKSDMTIACNFSFFIFKSRDVLRDYFKAAHHALSSKGIFLLEMAGGPGMIKTGREQKTMKPGKSKFVYIWDQKSFNPINHDAFYAIHFKLPDGTRMMDAFTYDWRLWTIPELREVLLEAGFSKAIVYWETTHDGIGTGEYKETEKATNDYAYITYVIGLK